MHITICLRGGGSSVPMHPQPPPQKPSPTGSESIIPRRGVDVSPFITSLGLSSSTNRAPLLSDCAVEKKMQRQGNVIIIRKAEIEVEGARVGGGRNDLYRNEYTPK